MTKQETNDEFEIPDTFVSLSRSKQAEEYVKELDRTKLICLD